jgi:hypothetical protein
VSEGILTSSEIAGLLSKRSVGTSLTPEETDRLLVTVREFSQMIGEHFMDVKAVEIQAAQLLHKVNVLRQIVSRYKAGWQVLMQGRELAWCRESADGQTLRTWNQMDEYERRQWQDVPMYTKDEA